MTPATRGAASAAQRIPSGSREHHVTADYSYVSRDLMAVTAISVVTLAFIVAMSFFL